MIIDRNVAAYCILESDLLSRALEKVDQNRSRVAFTVDNTQRPTGVLSDGDVRRWLIDRGYADLSVPVSAVARPRFVSALLTDPPEKVTQLFRDGIDVIPLLDAHGHLAAFATLQDRDPVIGPFTIGKTQQTLIVAEIGNNHNGDPGLARHLVDLAHASGADCVKFQMRQISSLYRNGGGVSVMREDLGTEYTLDLLARFNLPADSLLDVMDYARRLGLLPLCTPWDPASVEILDTWGVDAFKIASADLTNHDLLIRVAATAKPVLLSTGMSRESEIAESVGLLQAAGTPLVLLHCNSTYPTPLKDVNLSYIPHLADRYGCPVGYSGHERGAAVAVAAVALGARVIEKHFTVDRTMEGVDHKVSLLPDEFADMVQAIRDVDAALGNGGERCISQGEMINRENLAKSLVATRAIARGERVEESDIHVASPGRGIQPNRKTELIGRRMTRDIAAGDFFYAGDLADAPIRPRSYRLRRQWGIPVRYHDLDRIVTASNPDFVEYHLSYRDLDEDPGDSLAGAYDLDFVVHCPELFEGDFLLDLCADEEQVRERSIRELERVIAVTRRLRGFHRPQKTPIPIVTNVGGFSSDGPRPGSQTTALYRRLEACLARLDADDIEILPQTMPPFPWHFGGQSHHNIFVDGEEIGEYCQRNRRRICLDISHSQLACTHARRSMRTFLDAVGPFVGHMHIADAKGVDGEGLQIGEGDIDFGTLSAQLQRVAPSAGFIPEIWQGHKNDGEGFWTAMDRLEQWF